VRLATYDLDGAVSCGVVLGDRIAPLAGQSVKGILEQGPDHWSALAVDAADPQVALADVRLLPPVPDPDKILCIGLNYRDHAEETGMPAPSVPIVFAKFRNSLAGAADPIVLPDASEAVDYEAELAVVIGRRCRGVDAAEALDYVAGAMAFNDVSARDLQMQTGQARPWCSWTKSPTCRTCGSRRGSMATRCKPDDLVEVEIETLGLLANPVVEHAVVRR
jgi:acylpyruvate hydrolase